MQTFLPYADFKESAKCLDYKRLGKQRVEAKQILDTIEGRSKGWKNHPAVKMWLGHSEALKQYLREIIIEWIRRGYKNTMQIPEEIVHCTMPDWLGREGFHASHRSNLKRKDCVFYNSFTELPNLPYVWPTPGSFKG